MHKPHQTSSWAQDSAKPGGLKPRGGGETGENRHGPPAWLPDFIVAVVSASVKPEDPWVLPLDTALNVCNWGRLGGEGGLGHRLPGAPCSPHQGPEASQGPKRSWLNCWFCNRSPSSHMEATGHFSPLSLHVLGCDHHVVLKMRSQDQHARELMGNAHSQATPHVRLIEALAMGPRTQGFNKPLR